MTEPADQREVVFNEALAAALQAGDIAAAVAQERIPSAEDLAAQVREPAQRQAVLAAAGAQEAAYRASVATPPHTRWQPVRLKTGEIWDPVSSKTGAPRQPVSPKSGAVALAGMCVLSAATIFVYHWANGDLTSGAVWVGYAGYGLGGAALLLVIVAIVAGLVACVGWVMSPGVRNRPSVEMSTLAGVAFLLIQLVVTVIGFFVSVTVIDQVHANHVRASLSSFSGWFWPSWIIPSVALVFYVAAVWKATWSISDLPFFVSSKASPDSSAATAVKEAEWREALRDAIEAFLRREISRRAAQRFSTVLHPFANGSGLSKVRGYMLSYDVSTAAHAELGKAAAGMDGGAIALSGPRGVGKSHLLTRFCTVNEQESRFGLFLDVPVSFDAREFMLHLFALLCEFARGTGLATGPARDNEAWLLYQATISDGVSAGAAWGPLSFGGTRGISRTAQPLPYPQILKRLNRFLGEIAEAAKQAHPGCRLVIGIDELDRIEPIGKARDFLNELRPLFEASDWLFVLSVSDEALREAGIGRPDHPDVFDSAIDETVRIGPFTYRQSVELMGRRAIGMPEPFTALFHCLAGGMPRSMLRLARAAAAYAAIEPPEPGDGDTPAEPPAASRTLAETAAYLVARTWDRRTDAPNPALRSVHATILEIFSGNCDPHRIERAAGPGPGSFDTLAALVLEAAADGAARADGESGGAPAPDRAGFGARVAAARRGWNLPTESGAVRSPGEG